MGTAARSTRRLLLALAPLALAACAATATTPRADPNPTDVQTAASASRTPPVPPPVQVQVLSGASPNPSGPGAYRYSVEYPQLAGMSGRLQAIDADVQGTMQRQVDDFVDAARAAPEAAAGSQLTCASRAVRVTARLAVLRVDCTDSLAGARRAGTESQTFNCDLDAGTVLRLQDLFRTGAGYLNVISQTALQQLSAHSAASDGATLAARTAPIADNFKHFLLGPHDLVIIFAGGQTASGGTGQPNEVTVSYASLERYLAPGVEQLAAA